MPYPIITLDSYGGSFHWIPEPLAGHPYPRRELRCNHSAADMCLATDRDQLLFCYGTYLTR